MLLAYEITTPTHEDFGNVQTELGIEEKGAVLLQMKDPNTTDNNNPRAANMPRDKKAHVGFESAKWRCWGGDGDLREPTCRMWRYVAMRS